MATILSFIRRRTLRRLGKCFPTIWDFPVIGKSVLILPICRRLSRIFEDVCDLEFSFVGELWNGRKTVKSPATWDFPTIWNQSLVKAWFTSLFTTTHNNTKVRCSPQFEKRNIKEWRVEVHKLEKVHLKRKDVFKLRLGTGHLWNNNRWSVLTLFSLPRALKASNTACHCTYEERKDSYKNFQFKILMQCIMTKTCMSTVVRLRSVERSDALMIQNWV